MRALVSLLITSALATAADRGQEAQAWNQTGMAFQFQGRHSDAERAYSHNRSAALSHFLQSVIAWEGRPGVGDDNPVMGEVLRHCARALRRNGKQDESRKAKERSKAFSPSRDYTVHVSDLVE
jgi:hypothetical protein